MGCAFTSFGGEAERKRFDMVSTYPAATLRKEKGGSCSPYQIACVPLRRQSW